MKELVLESYGKINLGLDVLYKRDDGYHELNTIMQQISLKDIITIRDRKDRKDISIESNNRNLPLGPTNLAYQAWQGLKERSGINRGIDIKIQKQIPISAGLGGGSTNAASILKGLNQLWDLGLDDEELRKIGKELGADIPYCLAGGTVLARGIGEKLTRLKSFKGKDLLLINPGIAISTRDTYEKLDLREKEDINMEKIIRSLEDEDLKALGESMGNIMEKLVIGENPIIGEIKKDMGSCGARGSLMSGSGPTVFGIFEDRESRDYCYEQLLDKYSRGIIIKAETI